MTGKAALIGVDWGTTAMRACLIDAAGAALDRRESASGIMAVKAGAFEAALADVIGGWLGETQLPILMSGMIGSRQGWLEAPYLPCPAGGSELTAALSRIASQILGTLYLVPGICSSGGKWPDVMRGEETQIIGALEASGEAAPHFVLPGTHSKWVRVEHGRIAHFATYMTGEVFAALRDHTILGRTMSAPKSAHHGDSGDLPPGFAAGLEAAAALTAPGALLARLFSVRALTLFDQLSAEESEGFLSGLLIGAEIGAAEPQGDVMIIASEQLTRPYAFALRHFGVEPRLAPEDCAAMGQFTLAHRAKLIA